MLTSVQRADAEDIRRPADLAGPSRLTGYRLAGRCLQPDGHATLGDVEIRLVLDGIDPPTGHLHAMDGPDNTSGLGAQIAFAGWLGLLRALYSVTDGPGNPVIGAT